MGCVMGIRWHKFHYPCLLLYPAHCNPLSTALAYLLPFPVHRTFLHSAFLCLLCLLASYFCLLLSPTCDPALPTVFPLLMPSNVNVLPYLLPSPAHCSSLPTSFPCILVLPFLTYFNLLLTAFFYLPTSFPCLLPFPTYFRYLHTTLS